jgi:hypothetical protein
MNVYVVSAVWDHVGAAIIGAATERSDAESIAERYPDDDPWVKSWTPWQERTDFVGGLGLWERSALLPDGTVHPSLSQEIVCVPLAGPDPAEVGRRVSDAIRSFATGDPR